VQLDTGLHGWYDPLNYLMDKVRRLLVGTGLVWLISSLELFNGLCYLSEIGYRTYMCDCVLGTL
jgi:hypothetical protein